MISRIKDVVDYVIDNLPNPDGVTNIHKFKYRMELGGKDLKGEYVAYVRPFTINSDAKSRNSDYAEYSVVVHCLFFMGKDDNLVDSYEGVINWMDKVFNVFHLSSLNQLVDHCVGDVSFDTRDSLGSDLSEKVVRGAIGFRMRRFVFKN